MPFRLFLFRQLQFSHFRERSGKSESGLFALFVCKARVALYPPAWLIKKVTK